MEIGIYEKLASEKVTDTTWNIGPDLSAFWQIINISLIVDLLDYCNYFDVFKYGLLYSDNDFKPWDKHLVKVKRCNLIVGN